MLTPQVREHPAFIAVGISIRTSNAAESNPLAAAIPELWQRYFQDTITTHILHKVSDSPPLGIYTDYESDHNGGYSLVIGHEVEDPNGTIMPGMVHVNILGGKYLVFSVKGNPPASVKSTWPEICLFFEESKEYRRAWTADFEVYRADGVEIFVSIV